jgi:hypothetical protein
MTFHRHSITVGVSQARNESHPGCDFHVVAVDEVTQGIGNAVPVLLGRAVTEVAAHAAAAA